MNITFTNISISFVVEEVVGEGIYTTSINSSVSLMLEEVVGNGSSIFQSF